MPRDTNILNTLRAYQLGRILAAMAAGPMSAQQLAEKIHLSRSGVQLYLTEMTRQTPRQAYIAEYAPAPVGHRRAPMYALGDKEDAPYPKARAPKGLITADDRKRQILELIGAGRKSSTEVVEAMNLPRAKIYMIELHAEKKLHIAKWRPNPDGGYPTPLYAVGDKPDVERPPAMTNAQKGARHWAKLKADPHRHGLLLQRNRMRKKPQTWASALFM